MNNPFKYILIVILSFAIPLSSLSQKPRKLKKMANKAYSRGDFYTAKFYYESYCKKKPDKLKYKKRLAELQYYTRDFRKAKLNYRDLYEKSHKEYPLASYFAAKAYQMTGQYDTAIIFYKAFLKDYKKDICERKYKKLSEVGIKGCNFALHNKDSLLKIAVIHLDTSINKAYNEFSPVPIDDETLWFAGIQSDTLLNRNQKIQKQFYQAKKVNGKWINLGLLNTGFNAPTMTTGNGAMSPSGNRFYFTRCRKNLSDKRICKLYYSERKNGKWNKAIELPAQVNDIEYTSTQPTVGNYSKDSGKEIIYFVSDRPGGKGGFDIWYTIFNKHYKSFTEARTLGSTINGPGDERTPFYDTKQAVLYFSSDSYPGYGGLDIFKAIGEKKDWTIPANMGVPLNSSFDDMYFINLNSEKGYFVSNRDGGIAFENENCCDDIYSFRWTSFIHFAISGDVVEMPEGGNKYLSVSDAKATLYLIDDDLKDDLQIGELKSDSSGKFFYDIEVGRLYKIIVSKENYFNKSYKFDTRNIDYSDTLYQRFILQKIPEKPIILNNVYFEFDSAVLLDSSKTSIDTTLIVLLNDNPNLKIRIQAHTDSKGNDKYNLRLSKRRAASIVTYLVSKGINRKNLISEGYGENRPIAPNTNPDGSDNPEGRQLNRRIEFVVVKE